MSKAALLRETLLALLEEHRRDGALVRLSMRPNNQGPRARRVC
jgi:hypothetical protein